MCLDRLCLQTDEFCPSIVLGATHRVEIQQVQIQCRWAHGACLKRLLNLLVKFLEEGLGIR